MSGHDPIAYVYEADIHCPACTEARFGRTADGFIAGENADGSRVTDDEGNEVGAIFPWDDDYPEGIYCGDCLGEIREPWDDDDEGS